MYSSSLIKEKAIALGFDAVGIAKVDKLPQEKKFLERWLDKGFNGEMAYMARNIDKREDPSLLVDEARSVIVTLTNYYTSLCQLPEAPLIARYAYGKDYHTVIKERLKVLLEETGGRVFVDSAPVFEGEWARRAGLGWIGKNTLLINKELGSFCFIGIIITPMVFSEYDKPFTEKHCGSCTRCIEACPTKALTPSCVNAWKCISYNTIEKRKELPDIVKRKKGNRIFGCEICQEVCPWNVDIREHQVADFSMKREVAGLIKADWLTMDEDKFQELFAGTPLERTGLKQLLQNLEM